MSDALRDADPPLPAEHRFVRGLAPNAANRVPLTPITFLERSASIWPDKVAVRHGPIAYTYREFEARCRRLAGALSRHGIRRGDTVAVLAPNVPALLEAHYAVPALGAILNALNVRQDATTLAFCLAHGGAKLLITDGEFAPVVKAALAHAPRDLQVIDVADAEGPEGERLGRLTYEELLADGDAAFAWPGPHDEWDSLALLYTSGTTGDPKGVVYHHRGAYLNALGNALAFGLTPQRLPVDAADVPLQRLDLYLGGDRGRRHACLPAPGRPDARSFLRYAKHGVTHLCGAPVVLTMLVHAPAEAKRDFDHVVDVATGGAAPPSAVIEAMEAMGFRVTHLYGLTESYGPATLCAWQDAWSALAASRAGAQRWRARACRCRRSRNCRSPIPRRIRPVPRDGGTMGEVMLRGNTVMKGYLDNEGATRAAFAGGWYHTGDLGVWHRDSYIEIKDRSKDIIISGGENISSLEVEECLYRHPHVMEAAVVARPDPNWGETPCAFVTLKPGATAFRSATSSSGAAPISRISRRRSASSSGHCRRRRPARSRSSCCASARAARAMIDDR